MVVKALEIPQTHFLVFNFYEIDVIADLRYSGDPPLHIKGDIQNTIDFFLIRGLIKELDLIKVSLLRIFFFVVYVTYTNLLVEVGRYNVN